MTYLTEHPGKVRFFYPLFLLYLSVFLVSSYSSRVQAEGFVEWQSANIQLLRGWDYEVGDDQRSIMTVEYVNRWRYGDLFVFIDRSWFDDGNRSAYGEFSPRFSFSRLFNKDFSYKLVKDITLSTTLEKGQNNIRAYLVGVGLDLKFPDFTFFSANLYNRHNPDLDKDTWQVTLVWTDI